MSIQTRLTELDELRSYAASGELSEVGQRRLQELEEWNTEQEQQAARESLRPQTNTLQRVAIGAGRGLEQAGQGAKQRLLQKRDRRITADGVVIIKAQNFRTREKNRAEALAGERTRTGVMVHLVPDEGVDDGRLDVQKRPPRGARARAQPGRQGAVACVALRRHVLDVAMVGGENNGELGVALARPAFVEAAASSNPWKKALRGRAGSRFSISVRMGSY